MAIVFLLLGVFPSALALYVGDAYKALTFAEDLSYHGPIPGRYCWHDKGTGPEEGKMTEVRDKQRHFSIGGALPAGVEFTEMKSSEMCAKRCAAKEGCTSFAMDGMQTICVLCKPTTSKSQNTKNHQFSLYTAAQKLAPQVVHNGYEFAVLDGSAKFPLMSETELQSQLDPLRSQQDWARMPAGWDLVEYSEDVCSEVVYSGTEGKFAWGAARLHFKDGRACLTNSSNTVEKQELLKTDADQHKIYVGRAKSKEEARGMKEAAAGAKILIKKPVGGHAAGDPHVKSMSGHSFDLHQIGDLLMLVYPRNSTNAMFVADDAAAKTDKDSAKNPHIAVHATIDRLGNNRCGPTYIKQLKLTGDWMGKELVIRSGPAFEIDKAGEVVGEADDDNFFGVSIDGEPFVPHSQVRERYGQEYSGDGLELTKRTKVRTLPSRTFEVKVQDLTLKVSQPKGMTKANFLDLQITGLKQLEEEVGGLLGIDDVHSAQEAHESCGAGYEFSRVRDFPRLHWSASVDL
jgi:hypothetical protein